MSMERAIIALLTAATVFLGQQAYTGSQERGEIRAKASATCEDVQALREDLVEVLSIRTGSRSKQIDEQFRQQAVSILRRPACS